MGRRAKSHDPPPLIREYVAQNVEVLRDRHFTSGTVTARNRELAKAARTSLSQVQRVVERKAGVSIDGLEKLAVALRCRPQDLLTPYFSAVGMVDPQNIDDPAPPPPLSSRRKP